MTETDDTPDGEINPSMQAKTSWWYALAWGVVSGWLFVFLPYFLVVAWRQKGFGFLLTPGLNGMDWVFNGSILLLMPIVQGFASALRLGPDKRAWNAGSYMTLAIWLIDTLVAIIFIHEGAICLLMAFPLLWTMIGVAYVAGRYAVRWRRGTTASVSLIPLALLVTVGETLGPKPNAPEVVTDQIAIQAPPEYVWRYVVGYPENNRAAHYWIWQMGLPTPINSIAQGETVGAKRMCRFTGGQYYEERITVLEPQRRLVYDVTRQMTHPEIAGHVTFDQGEVTLLPNKDGSTTMTMTGRYRLHVRPAPYFAWWAEDITRHIHVRVMTYTKALAERDYRAAQAR